MAASSKPNAKFYDGKTATPHDINVEASGSYIRLNRPDGSLLKSWSYNEIKILEDAEPPLPAKLGSAREPHARLVINDFDEWKKIRGRIPHKLPGKLPTHALAMLGYLGFAIAVVLGVYRLTPVISEGLSYLIPRALEQKLGDMTVRAMVQNPVCVAPAGRKALDKIVARLERGLKDKSNFMVYVIEDKDIVNALTLPGGTLIVYSGLLDKAESPEEVMGVLAHELAHGELRHPVRGLARDLSYSLLFTAMFGGHDGTGRMGALLSQMSFSRGDESAADREGQKILQRAGLDPQDMALFFRKLEKDEPAQDADRVFVYLSTHPLTSDRIREMEKIQAPPQQAVKILNGSEWQALKNICAKTQDPMTVFNPVPVGD